jgi:sirohydrochlorin cobaltochelatase
MDSTMQAKSPHAIILFAHGSRDPLWRGPVETVARKIAARAPNVPVACAYLELCLPDLPTCAADLIAQGAQSLTVLPLFLGVGKHAREDLPGLIADLRQNHPDVLVHQKPFIGEDDRLLDLIADLALSAPP